MAKAEEKVLYKDLSVDDLKSQLGDCAEKIYRLKFKHAVAPLKNPLEIRSLKRERARILTWIRQKELVVNVKAVTVKKKG